MKNRDLKQVIIVRKDLKIGKGKLAVQVAHASISSFIKIYNKDKIKAEEWLKSGQKKVVVKVKNLEELLKIYEELNNKGYNPVLIKDKGLTQVPEGTITCIGIGPIETKKIDEVTSKLKLL